MVDTSEIIEELRVQEDKGFFKSLRRIKRDQVNYQPTIKSIIQNIPFHIQNAVKLTGEFKFLEKFDRIIIAGVGINGIAGDLIKEYLSDYKYTIDVCRDFSLPQDVNNKTLVFILSFSGNDEEAINCYKNALKAGSKIIGITSGGRLLEGFKKNNTEQVIIPAKLPESTVLVYLFFPVIAILDNSKLIRPQKESIEETIKSLKKPELREMARSLYEKMQDKIPVIYTSKRFHPVAKYWKVQFNLVSKIPTFISQLNDEIYEINTYIRDQWDFYLIFLRDDKEQREIQKTMSIVKKLIKNKNHGTTEIAIKGTNYLARIFTAIYISDFTAYFLSEYYKVEEDLLAKYREEYKNP